MQPGARGDSDIYLYAALTSLLLSAVAFALGLTPNDDAFVYLRTAELATTEGLRTAFAHYPWAIYPLLIAAIQTLPGINFLAAAQLLNALLYLITTLSFMAVVQHINGSRRLLTLAAMVILAYPHINEFRFHLIRDIGMLGFTLLAMLQLLRYQRTWHWSNALGFCLASLLATLFRGEALMFLALVPVSLLFSTERTWPARARAITLVYAVAALLALTALAALQLVGISMLAQLHSSISVYLPFVQQSLATLHADDPALVSALFSDHAAQFSAQHTALIVSTGMAAMLAATIVESFGLIVVAILIYGGWRSLQQLPTDCRNVLLGYVLTALIIMLGFVLVSRFTTTRYTMVFCTSLILLLPFIIDNAWRLAIQQQRLRRFAIIALPLFTYSVMDAHISYGEARTHSADAMSWLSQNATAETELMTNKSYIAWLSGRITQYDRVEHDLDVSDFLSAPAGTFLLIERDEPLFAQLLAAEDEGVLQLIHRINDRRGARILIFKRR